MGWNYQLRVGGERGGGQGGGQVARWIDGHGSGRVVEVDHVLGEGV